MKLIGKPLILGVIFLLLSFAITVQVRITNSSESEASQEKVLSGLKDEIFRLNGNNEKLIESLDSVEEKLEKVRSEAAEKDSSNVEKSELIKKYTIIDGRTEVKGQGIIIRYYPSEYSGSGIKIGNADITKDLVDIVNELKNAGAEAIAVNDIRITNTSSIEMEKNVIVVDGQRISRPYIIKSIGKSDTMNSSLIRPGGTIELIKNDRAKIELAISKEVRIPKAPTIQ
ncbi:MAG: DUF881 domain-containing protein [Clostridia bacterium]|nr:DUF881 domain-containing protein [Clostridia bacterium]